MAKGQRAMAAAKINPEPEKSGRGNNSFVAKDFSGAGISKARTIIKWTPELAHVVLNCMSAAGLVHKKPMDKKRVPAQFPLLPIICCK